MFNVIIIGAEDTENYDFFKEKTINLLRNKAKSGEGITIFTIGDSFIDTFTTRYHIDKNFFKTDWKSFGNDALKYRNEEILKNANAIIYFNKNKKDLNILYDQAVKNNLACRKIEIPKVESV